MYILISNSITIPNHFQLLIYICKNVFTKNSRRNVLQRMSFAIRSIKEEEKKVGRGRKHYYKEFGTYSYFYINDFGKVFAKE